MTKQIKGLNDRKSFMKPPLSNKGFPPFQGTCIHTCIHTYIPAYIHTYIHTCFIYLEPYTIKKESYEAPRPPPPPPPPSPSLSLSLSLPPAPSLFFTTKGTINELIRYGLFTCRKFRFVLIFGCKTANVVHL